ncbi:MAG: hypothetical protein K0Q43_87 [Ramlibacter sp.]|jgi:hypothetical protein|nr:hypothetical protein [Ramlibacter sp.]
MFFAKVDVNAQLRTSLVSLLDGLARLGFAREGPVNGADLVDFLNEQAPVLWKAFHAAVKAGPQGSDPHLFVAASTAFTPLLNLGFYNGGDESISGCDATDECARIYHELAREPVPLGLPPQAIYSPDRGGFYTGGADGGWGGADEALLLHDCSAPAALQQLGAAKVAVPDAQWLSFDAVVSLCAEPAETVRCVPA